MDRNRGLSNLSHLLTKHGDRQLFKNAQIIFEEKKKKKATISLEGHCPPYKTGYTVIQTFSANKTRFHSVTVSLSSYKRN